MPSVFITGALGFIGRALGDRYRSLGAEVCGVDRSADPGLGVVAGDTSEPGPWQRRAAGADLVVHTAAIVSNAHGHDARWRVNVLGTRRALDAARDGGARRFVHLSSVRAFSDRDFPDGVTEEWPVRTDGAAYVDRRDPWRVARAASAGGGSRAGPTAIASVGVSSVGSLQAAASRSVMRTAASEPAIRPVGTDALGGRSGTARWASLVHPHNGRARSSRVATRQDARRSKMCYCATSTFVTSGDGGR